MGGSIQFAKDDQPIILDSGCAHCQLDISNDGQASLTINRVSFKDQGHWQCWRLDANGKVKQKIPIIQLVVTNSPELPILIVNDKELLGGNNVDASITVKENEIINFKCLIRGAATPVDYVHWMLDSTQNVTHLSMLSVEYSPQENNFLTQSVLKLNATKSMNLKSISCLSNHQLWMTPMTVTAFMNVLYEPSFTISREPGFGVPVSEGMSVILKCEIDSNPSSNPIWIKDADNKTAATSTSEQQLQNKLSSKQDLPTSQAEPIILDTQEDGSVVFQPVTQADSGWYRCKTENRYGNFSSFGYYLNVRPAGSQANTIASSTSQPASAAGSQGPLQQASKYNSQTMNHHQQSNQRVMRPNQAPQPAAQFNSAQPQTNSLINDQPAVQFPLLPPKSPSAMSLATTSSSSMQQQSSELKCPQANNQRQLDGFPQIEQPVSTINAILGHQLIIPLRFCCNPGPARVFWIHRHLAMTPGRMLGPYITRDIYTTYNSFYCYESTFEIDSVKPEDIGTVYVFVTNDKGHAGAQIHIQLATGNSPYERNHNTLLGSRFSLTTSDGTSSRLQSPIVILSSLLLLATCLITLQRVFFRQSISIKRAYENRDPPRLVR